MINSKAAKSLIGVGVSLGALWIAYRSVEDWGAVGEALTHINYWYLIHITVLFVVQFTLRSIRWGYLLPGSESGTIRERYDAIMVGNFGNYILPFRAGEFMRPMVLARKTHHSYSTCLISVVTERFFDLACVLASFGLVAATVSGLPEWVLNGAYVLGALAAGIFLFILCGVGFPDLIGRLIDFFCAPLGNTVGKHLAHFAKEFLEGARVLQSPSRLFAALLLSVSIWYVTFLQFYISFNLFNMTGITFWDAVVVGVVVALAVAAPSVPGFFGVFQAACIAGFILINADQSIAAAYSIVVHIHQYILICGYGAFLLLTGVLKRGDFNVEEVADIDPLPAAN
jgi:hypothetical protein